MSYEGADIFLLFYSIINPTSFENIKEKVMFNTITLKSGASSASDVDTRFKI